MLGEYCLSSCQQVPMLAAKLKSASDSFSCSVCSSHICTASKNMMLLGMEAGALHALTLISLTCSAEVHMIFTVHVVDNDN